MKNTQKGCGCTTVRGTSINAKSSPVNNPATNPIGFATNLGAGFKRVAPEPSFWETGLEKEMVKNCGVFDEKIDVLISTKARQKMNILMKKFDRMEWLAYLVGDKDENVVEDIIIPKQRVTSVNVYVDEPVDVPIIGVIHSHHDMGNGFSHTDDDFINANHDLSLCITNTKITGQLRVKTECGRYMLADVNVEEAYDGFDVGDFLKEVDTQISEKVIVTTYGGGGVGGAGRVGGNVSHLYGNTAGWAGFEEDEIDGWDAEAPSTMASVDREVLSATDSYRESLKGMIEVDDFYLVEFSMIVNFIDSVGTPNYEIWETKAFDDTDNVYTEAYYRLIDEISLFNNDFTSQESMALRTLARELEKRVEVGKPN